MEAASGAVISSLVRVAFSIVEIITRRAAITASAYAADHIDAHRQTLLDINKTIEKETTLILQALNSRQQAKLKSAYQHIEMALSDLGQWNLEDGVLVQPNAAAISQSVALKSISADSSKYFNRAMQHLYDADTLAMDVFNDEHNSTAYMRIDALHLRIFCQTLLNWDNKKLWFEKWKLVLKKFFDDKDLFRLVIGKQSSLSKLISKENAKLIKKRFYSLIDCLDLLTHRMLFMDYKLTTCARDLMSFIGDNVEVKQESKKTKLPRLLLDRDSFKFDTIWFPIYYNCVKDFCVVKDGGNYEILAISYDNRFISCCGYYQSAVIGFDQRFTYRRLEYFSDKQLLSIAYVQQLQQLSVLYKMDSKLYVMHMHRSGDDTCQFPDTVTDTDKYRISRTPMGAIFVSKNDGEKQYVKFTDSTWWFALPETNRKNFQIVFDNPGSSSSVIGMTIFGNFVTTTYIQRTISGIDIRDKDEKVLDLKNKSIHWMVSPPVPGTNVSESDVYAVGYDDNRVCIATALIRCYDQAKGGHDKFVIHDVMDFDMESALMTLT